MRKYFNVIHRVFSLSFQQFLYNRADFLMWMAVSVGWTLFTIVFYLAIFSQTTSISGWSQREMMVFLGVYMLIDTFTWNFFYSNMMKFATSIHSGSFDYVLMKPIDPQFFVSFQYVGVSNILRAVTGVALIVMNLDAFSSGALLLSSIFFVIALIFQYCFWIMSACLAFYFERMQNSVEIVAAMRRFWSMPSDIYRGLLSAILTIIIPFALITTIPAKILIGKTWLEHLIPFLLATVFFFMLARFIFIRSIKRYSGAGS